MIGIIIDKAQVTSDRAGLSAEASTLSLRPGEPWPETITVIDASEQRSTFYGHHRVTNSEGETDAMVYKSQDGTTLTVFND